MANVNLKFSIKDIIPKLTKNLSWAFFALFLILVLFEIAEINNSLQIVLQSNQEPPVPINKEKGVRINFDNYNYDVNRVRAAGIFNPSGGIEQNPFQ